VQGSARQLDVLAGAAGREQAEKICDWLCPSMTRVSRRPGALGRFGVQGLAAMYIAGRSEIHASKS